MKKEGFLAIILLLLITILIAFVTYNLPKQVLLSPEVTSLSSFQVSSMGTYGIEVSVSIKDGIADLDILYGNGTDFLYVAGNDDGTDILRTSNTNKLAFDRDTDDYFIASWSDNTLSESYLLDVTSTIEDTSVHENYTTIQNKITGVYYEDKKRGDIVIIGNIELTIGEIHRTNKWVNLTINSGGSFNKTYDTNGYYINLPTQDMLPLSQYYIEIFNSTGSLVQKYLAYFVDNQATINGSCVDADSGLTYNAPSFASEGALISNDNCIDTIFLNESYCDSGNIKSQIYNCSLINNICQDRACFCVPSWQTNTTACTQDETTITYYTDANDCGLTPAQNQTSYCDYDSNGLIGNFSSFSQTNLNLQIYINGTLAYSNTTEIFNTPRNIEFRESSITRVSFNYDFSSPLNLKIIEIIKQPASSEVGYLIVKGIETEKTLAIDKLNNESWKVCIKDSDVESIDELTERCTATNEYPVSCPGNLSGFTCTISDNKFIVTNLDHSAVKELINISGSIDTGECTSNWLCSSWSSCSNNQQTRTCVDANNCSIPTNIPNETWVCVSCNTNWTCTNWTPASCPETKQQTRICTDTNNCGTQTNKPSQTQTCNYEKSSLFFWIILITLIVLIVIVAVAIVYTWNKNQQRSFRYSSPFKIQSSQQKF